MAAAQESVLPFLISIYLLRLCGILNTVDTRKGQVILSSQLSSLDMVLEAIENSQIMSSLTVAGKANLSSPLPAHLKSRVEDPCYIELHMLTATSRQRYL